MPSAGYELADECNRLAAAGMRQNFEEYDRIAQKFIDHCPHCLAQVFACELATLTRELVEACVPRVLGDPLERDRLTIEHLQQRVDTLQRSQQHNGNPFEG